ncbi:hypothetical protein B0H14DRAFT_3863152 [Mycena olivaceomarginata]|nr:hypothetical protein B0H14DRAFT_3863152 [Mycena olivaceomarginata]
MRPTSTAALLAAATLIGATTINIPHTATVNRTTGCATTTGSTVSPNTTPSKAAPARATTSTSRARADYSESTFPEDLQFVSDLLDEIHTGWCTDNSRIYATGLSIGAAFFNTIVCAPVGATLAASAAGSSSCFLLHRQRGVTGQMRLSQTSFSHFADPCTRARTLLPVLEIHGGIDTDVPYSGGAGEGGTERAIPDWCVRSIPLPPPPSFSSSPWLAALRGK